jgi:hypothetical protein
MVHERELVPLPSLHADDKDLEKRWPVPYAIMFVTVVSAGLWSAIIALSSWLIG